MKNNSSILLILLSMMVSVPTLANVSLPAFFSDNMVLQRNAQVKIWGWASPFEDVTIITSWDNKEYKLRPDNAANWEQTIQTPGAGGPYTIIIKGYNEIILNNVMLGEVWFCSGQSNMEWTPNSGIDNAEAEIAQANYPNIRFFSVPKLSSQYPQINVPGSWDVCTPQTMKHFSAIGYFFATHLQDELKDVPIGIINSSWGGSPAEVWIPEDFIIKDPILKKAASKLTPVEWSPVATGLTFNAMVNPFAGFRIAGVLWYQGESNVGSDVYDKTLKGLIESWREKWEDNFPFYYVQIAPYNYEGDNYQGVVIRDAQRRALQAIPKSGMVVVSDISPTDDIHPRNKRTVGERLANLALSNHYGIERGIVNGPLLKTTEINGKTITVYFDNAEGLHFKDETKQLFEIAAEDGVFYKAEAKIKNDTVVLTSKKVKSPARVRFAWHNTAQSNLFNKAGLPASSFISE